MVSASGRLQGTDHHNYNKKMMLQVNARFLKIIQ